MFHEQEKSTGTTYTGTVALLIGAFIVSPGVLFASYPFGYPAIAAASTGSLICVVMAWMQWKRHSDVTMSTITGPEELGK